MFCEINSWQILARVWVSSFLNLAAFPDCRSQRSFLLFPMSNGLSPDGSASPPTNPEAVRLSTIPPIRPNVHEPSSSNRLSSVSIVVAASVVDVAMSRDTEDAFLGDGPIPIREGSSTCYWISRKKRSAADTSSRNLWRSAGASRHSPESAQELGARARGYGCQAEDGEGDFHSPNCEFFFVEN